MYSLENSRNVLDITNAEVAADWTLGMARSMGLVLLKSGTVGTASLMFGKNAETKHLEACGADSIVAMIHDFEEEAIYDSFDSYRTTTNEALRGKVTCKCGEVEGADIAYVTNAGDLIYSLTDHA